jgi:X box-binding protein 1
MKINYYEISRIPTVDARKVLATIEDDEKHPERKRRRLDNLNLEERVLRRKLKNRVAAQTARDRKKAYMDSLDSNLGRVERENKFLKQSNEELRSQVCIRNFFY